MKTLKRLFAFLMETNESYYYTGVTADPEYVDDRPYYYKDKRS